MSPRLDHSRIQQIEASNQNPFQGALSSEKSIPGGETEGLRARLVMGEVTARGVEKVLPNQSLGSACSRAECGLAPDLK